MRRFGWIVGSLVLAASVATGCGSGDGSSARGSGPTIVVTTSVLGDIVSSMVGDAASVTVLMGSGASPHDFQASARQVAELREADLVIANGGGFEQGLIDVLEAAEGDGVTVHDALSSVDAIAYGERSADHDHDHEGETPEEHAAHDDDADGEAGHEGETPEEHAAHDDHGHDHDGVDPHFFTDPARTVRAAEGILEAIVAAVPALDTPEVRATAEDYLDELRALDAEIEQTLSSIPEADRVLVTNHESLGYFADRYGFELVGAVIPATTTTDTGNAADLAALAAVIRDREVPAIFADTSSSTRLADRLAQDVGRVEVVELYSESLGDAGSGADTYVGMQRTNAERIAAALA